MALVIFQQAGDSQHSDKKRLIGTDSVVIVWSEQSRDFDSRIVKSNSCKVQIVVSPLSLGAGPAGQPARAAPLFRVRIFSTSHTAFGGTIVPAVSPELALGPLYDGMIVHACALAQLVRQTSLQACAMCNWQQQHQRQQRTKRTGATLQASPYDERRARLEELVSRYTQRYDDEVMLQLLAPDAADVHIGGIAGDGSSSSSIDSE